MVKDWMLFSWAETVFGINKKNWAFCMKVGVQEVKQHAPLKAEKWFCKKTFWTWKLHQSAAKMGLISSSSGVHPATYQGVFVGLIWGWFYHTYPDISAKFPATFTFNGWVSDIVFCASHPRCLGVLVLLDLLLRAVRQIWWSADWITIWLWLT